MEMGRHQSCCFFLSLESKLLKFLPVHSVHPSVSWGASCAALESFDRNGVSQSVFCETLVDQNGVSQSVFHETLVDQNGISQNVFREILVDQNGVSQSMFHESGEVLYEQMSSGGSDQLCGNILKVLRTLKVDNTL